MLLGATLGSLRAQERHAFLCFLGEGLRDRSGNSFEALLVPFWSLAPFGHYIGFVFNILFGVGSLCLFALLRLVYFRGRGRSDSSKCWIYQECVSLLYLLRPEAWLRPRRRRGRRPHETQEDNRMVGLVGWAG